MRPPSPLLLPHTRTRVGSGGLARGLAVVVAVVLPLGALACSGDDSDAGPTTAPSQTTPPEDPLAECPDPAEDLFVVGQPDDVRSADPPAIDLRSARVEVTEAAVTVTFTTEGEIESAPGDPTFVLFRGVMAGQQGGFEVQATRVGGGWAVNLVDYAGRVGERSPIEVPVEVEGSTLRVSVERALLPPLAASRLWSFGSSHRPPDGAAVTFDECSLLGEQPAAETSTTVAGASTPPTTD